MRGRTLFVTNLPYDFTIDDTKHLFERYGVVSRCDMPRGKCFFFVEFEDDRDADYAKDRMDRKEIEGKPITVQFAREGPTRNWRDQNRVGGGGGRERSRFVVVDIDCRNINVYCRNRIILYTLKVC
eukprot:GHVL01023987.1.p1 GENE.GHVL01023987.1~~GHVL01023987.1.p1  ORF type:complete len:126 (-),score=8.55 GHVL01023987.1:352-729(-)